MTESFPHFFGNMRCQRIQKANKRFHSEPPCRNRCGICVAKVAYGVGECIELCHSLVEAECLDVGCHCIDGAVSGAQKVGPGPAVRQVASPVCQRRVSSHAVDPLQETRCTLNPGLCPLHIALWRGIRQHEQPSRVRSICFDDQVRINNIPLRLAHLLDAAGCDVGATLPMPPYIALALHLGREQPFAVAVLEGLVTDHPLGHQPGKGLVHFKIAGVTKGSHEKA